MKRNDRRQDDSWQDYPEGQEDFSVHYEDDFGEPQDTYDDGYDDGYGDSGGYSDTAYDGGYAASYSEGYDDSYNDGYDDGYSDYDGGYGYDDGYGGYDSYDGGGYDDGAYYDESPEPGPSPKKRRREKKAREGKPAKPKKKFRPFGCLWSILWKLLILAVVAVVGFTGFLFVRLEPVDFPSGTELGANTSISQSGIHNIALFGVDARDYSTNARSDAIMILSVNTGTGSLKLSTLMRDTLVSVPGYGDMKLTEAYAYGGPELAVQTINQNFGLDITEYATVTFAGMAEIIDAAGGGRGRNHRRGAGFGQRLDLGAMGRLRDGRGLHRVGGQAGALRHPGGCLRPDPPCRQRRLPAHLPSADCPDGADRSAADPPL